MNTKPNILEPPHLAASIRTSMSPKNTSLLYQPGKKGRWIANITLPNWAPKRPLDPHFGEWQSQRKTIAVYPADSQKMKWEYCSTYIATLHPIPMRLRYELLTVIDAILLPYIHICIWTIEQSLGVVSIHHMHNIGSSMCNLIEVDKLFLLLILKCIHMRCPVTCVILIPDLSLMSSATLVLVAK